MNQKLADLVQEKVRQSSTGERIDWDSRRDKYIEAVNALYERIQLMLADAIGQKAVTPEKRDKQLTESYIGTYAINDLILVIGDEPVRFSPRGRNIAGAEGRVDVVGERGEAMLILQGSSDWGFVQSRQPKVTVVPLDDATLAEVLRMVMRD